MNWSRPLVPDAWAPAITALEPELLIGQGFRGLIVDLDNTLTGWNSHFVEPATGGWLERARGLGLRLCIVSNNGAGRVRAFADSVGLPSVAHAGKPRRGGYRRALALLGTAAADTAVIGDQLWTDVVGARRMNMYAILVQPMAPREFWGTRSLRWLERAWVARLRRRGLGLPFGA